MRPDQVENLNRKIVSAAFMDHLPRGAPVGIIIKSGREIPPLYELFPYCHIRRLDPLQIASQGISEPLKRAIVRGSLGSLNPELRLSTLIRLHESLEEGGHLAIAERVHRDSFPTQGYFFRLAQQAGFKDVWFREAPSGTVILTAYKSP